MLLKRLAVVMVLTLLMQLAACKQELPDISTDKTVSSTTSQTVTGEEVGTESTAGSSVHGTDGSHDKTYSSGTSSDNKGTTASKGNVTGNKTTSGKSERPGTVQPEQGDDNQLKPAGCDHSAGDPYLGVDKAEFYADYTVACCNVEATYRSKHGLLSGSLNVPGQYAQESNNRPASGGKYIRNTATVYLDNGNTYVVLDAGGKETMRIHKAGGYITLEEVAAYMYAFGGNGTIPANYISKKSGKPSSSIWGEYLRLNHSYFIGDTDRYPYEPELPDISGCGGSLRYYEMDIGTTGTATPGYAATPYVQGNKITRGAARLVYARQDLNGNGIYENNEVYVFYTHNHYNDFREYLNYYGGWGKMFGNVTGGGAYSSETNANPTPYVPTAYQNFLAR